MADSQTGTGAAAARVRTERDRRIARYVREHVYPYSAYYRPRLDRAGIVNGDVKSASDLASLPFTTADEIADAGQLVLRPDEEGVSRSTDVGITARMAWAKLWRRVDALNAEVLEPAYKPIHWLLDGPLPVGYSAQDLDRLAELGRQWLEDVGLGPYDAIVNVLPAGPTLGFWELVLGARRGGVPAIHVGDLPALSDVAHLDPTVLAGRAGDLVALLTQAEREGEVLPHLHTVLVVGELLDEDTRRRLRSLAPAKATIAAAYAPAGVRSLWVECKGGIGYHTTTDADFLEIVDQSGVAVRPGADGEIVYSSLGWKGTAVLRLRTGVHGRLIPGACPGCGRTTPRLRLTRPLPRFAAVLEAHPGVAGWQAELRRVRGVDELLVYLTPATDDHPGKMLRQLDRELQVTQFIVLDADDLDDRLAAHDDQRVIDLRR